MQNLLIAKRTYTKFHPRINSVVSQLNSIAPRFLLQPGDVEILTDPKVFYAQLKEKISKAENRIFLSSLYIGKTQNELVEALSEALTKKPNLKLYILIDYLRATREMPDNCSLSLVSQLLKKHGSAKVDLRLYHTPHLSGVVEKLVPKRLNEGFGLQHMKIYGFDDELILSGANLSQDYFTNRQDRYYSFKSKNLSDYFFNLAQLVGKMSHKVRYTQRTNNLIIDWPSSNFTVNPQMDLDRFLVESTHLLEPVLAAQNNAEYTRNKEYKQILDTDKQIKNLESAKDFDEFPTIVYPVSQLTPILKPDRSTEKPAIMRLLSYADSSSVSWTFTAGYFNMDSDIKNRLLESTASSGEVITASPKANSFFKSKGISRHLPPAYLYLAQCFVKDIEKMETRPNVVVKEWENGTVNTPNGWSYHAKGIWVTGPDEKVPAITVIGSSNYTRRSYTADLETNAIVVTRDEELKKQMQNEIDNINKHTRVLRAEDFSTTDPDRKISVGVKIATNIVGSKL